MATNLTPQEQQLRAAILQRWGGSGAWGNDSTDLAGRRALLWQLAHTNVLA